MKILMAVHQLPPAEVGGVGLFSAHLAGALVMAGHEVTLLAGAEERSPDRTRMEPMEPAAPGVETLRVRVAGRVRQGSLLGSFINPGVDALVAELLRQTRPDVLHLQHTLQLSARLTSLGLAAGAAVVASVHDYWPLCQRIHLRRSPGGEECSSHSGGLRCALCTAADAAPPPGHPPRGRTGGALLRAAGVASRVAPYVVRTQVVQGCYARAHRITCPAPDVAQRLRRAGFDARRLVVVDYGIPPLPAAVATAHRPRQPFRFGYLGSLGEHKGVRVAINAMGRLADRPAQLLVHGGPLRDETLRAQLSRLEAEGLGRYCGPYTEADLPRVLAGIDALIIPSLWPETGPMVWMEAVAAGLPVVASRVGALPGRIKHGEDGFLVPPGNSGALADAMERTMEQYEGLRRGAMGRTVRGLDDVAGEVVQVYEEARAEAGPG